MSQHRASVRLVALVADRDIEESLAKLFGRPEHLGIRPFRFAIRRHPDRDAGCRSARIFGEIAAATPFEGCEDPAFKKLTATLREWFPKAG